MKSRTNPPGLSGNALKLIALVSMAVDHIGAVIIEVGLLHLHTPDQMAVILATQVGKNWLLVDRILRAAGRMAFPLFCFLLAEGFFHTRCLSRYLLRIFLFALLSEVPFDLANSNTWIDFGHQNVFFTLTIGLLVMTGAEYGRDKPWLRFSAVLAGCGLAYILRTDYDVIGILLIASFYFMRDNEQLRTAASGFLMIYGSRGEYGAAVLALIPIGLYNGQRGKPGLKYLFYWFYPVHLAVFFLFRLLILRISPS